MLSLIKRIGTAVTLGSFAVQIAAHSWVDMLMNIDSNGTMVGDAGYIRGYVPRSYAGYSDDMDDFLIPPNGRAAGNVIYANDSLCHPSQTIGNYSTDYPMLSVTAGGFIALRYQENGHVTLPDTNPTKPLNRGTVYIYGTTEPAADEYFESVFDSWTADGTGGNGRGRLLATRNFDDGQCYQINSQNISVTRQAEFSKTAESPQGSDLWCQNDFQLPSDLTTGTNYTLYWVWSWPTMNKAGSPTDVPEAGYNITTLQYYTSCMDVAVTGSNSTSAVSAMEKASTFASSFVEGQDLNNAAVLAQLTIGAFQVTETETAKATATGAATDTGTATGATITSSASQSSGSDDLQTVVVTVTQTQAPVYITVTKATGSSSSDGPVSTQTVTSTTSRRRTTMSTSTVSTAAAAITSSSSSVTGAVTTGQAPSVSPFLMRRVGRVRRHL